MIRLEPGSKHRLGHRRKYAEGLLIPERSFYFRGPQNALNLRAHNLVLFVEIAEGVDAGTGSITASAATIRAGSKRKSAIRISRRKRGRSSRTLRSMQPRASRASRPLPCRSALYAAGESVDAGGADGEESRTWRRQMAGDADGKKNSSDGVINPRSGLARRQSIDAREARVQGLAPRLCDDRIQRCRTRQHRRRQCSLARFPLPHRAERVEQRTPSAAFDGASKHGAKALRACAARCENRAARRQGFSSLHSASQRQRRAQLPTLSRPATCGPFAYGPW